MCSIKHLQSIKSIVQNEKVCRTKNIYILASGRFEETRVVNMKSNRFKIKMFNFIVHSAGQGNGTGKVKNREPE